MSCSQYIFNHAPNQRNKKYVYPFKLIRTLICCKIESNKQTSVQKELAQLSQITDFNIIVDLC
jgi:hypothetical protein